MVNSRFAIAAALIVVFLVASCGPATSALVPTSVAAPPAHTSISPTAASPPADTPAPPTVRPREPVARGALRITIIYNNTPYDPHLQEAWGLATLVEYRGHTLLFDTGGDPNIFVDNMDLLGIDPTSIEAIVLSHSHSDHVEGFPGLAQKGVDAPVYVLPSFPSQFRSRFGGQFELIDVTPGQELSDGIFTTGEMLNQDVRIYEQSLVISTTHGLVVVTGCAHPGIVEIVTQAKEMFDAPVHLVLGGFHLPDESRSEIQAIISDFRRLGVERAGPTHCTGEEAISMFAEAYGEAFVQAGVGSIIVIEQGTAGSPAATPAPAPPAQAVVSPTRTNTPVLEAISVDTVDQVERLQTLSGHGDRVIALAFSGDGAHVASSSLDKTIKLWDVEHWQEAHAFSMNKVGFNGIAFSPDGRLLASADAIWDVESGQAVHVLERGRNDPGPVAFSPDGSILAVALENRPIKLWDVASGQVLRTFEAQPDDVTFSIAFSPDGKRLAAGVHGGMVRLWDVERGQIAGTLEHGGESDDVHDVAFSPDGEMLASAGNDETVRLWDVASGQTVHILRPGNGLYGVAFSPDGSLVAAAGCDRTVKLWDVASGRQVRSLPHSDEVMAVAFSPDGTLIVSGGYDNQVYLWGVPR